MRDLNELSGSWVGFWVQGRSKGHMGLALTFSKDQIMGEGLDRVGPFTLSGSYTDGSIQMSKLYSSHRVEYKGTWTGSMIAGTWKIPFGGGHFEIWPETDHLGLPQFEEEVALTSH